MRRLYYALALILAPFVAACFDWPIGAACIALAVAIKRWPNRRVPRLARLRQQWKESNNA